MSRVQQLVRGLATGYVAIAVNIFYTLASVPLALHYLTRAEFALWALVMQIAGYLGLIDLGMSGSVYRILIDHKDTRADGRYGATFLAGWIVFTIQGALIAGCGLAASPWLAEMLPVPAPLASGLRWLIGGQCAVLGFGFAMKIFTIPLLSHQRQDVANLAAAGQFLINFCALWLGFALGWKVYALLVANVATGIYAVAVQGIASWQLGFLPHRGEWKRPAWANFRDVFVFGGDLFLLTVGWQLVAASQVIIITRTLGLEAVAVWVVCTKVFSLAQQMVWRIFDFSGPALSEMFVRGETDRLLQRLRDVTVLSASVAILAGGIVAAANGAFVHIWTRGALGWSALNDLLMGLLTVSYTVTRCLTMWVGVTKEIRGTRYVYLVEGVIFIAAAWLAAPRFGFTGIIVAALVADLLCCGGYGLFRTAHSFHVSRREILGSWLARPARFFAVFAGGALAVWWATQTLAPVARLALVAPVTAVLGVFCFWTLGLPAPLRAEIAGRFFRRAQA